MSEDLENMCHNFKDATSQIRELKRKNKELLEDKNNLLAVRDLARNFVKATVEWNEAVEKIIGRVPRTGIPIEELDIALKKIEHLK